jgi:DNA polymerase-3 subunit beta
MEFTVSQSSLVRELSFSQGVVEKKTTIPILSNVLIEASGDRIVLTATDLELGIRCSCPAKVKRPGSGTIPARRLLDYVRLLPDADIDIKVGENHWASIHSGRSKTRIAGMSRESFPGLPKMPEALTELPAKTLASMIAKTIFAISAEESRFTLNGALLLVRDTGLTMVATDGHRLAMVEKEIPLPSVTSPYRALLPRKAMQEVAKLAADAGPDDMLKFAGDDNHLFFEIGERLLLSRKLTGNFPDYERVLPKDHPQEVRVDRVAIRESIERVAQFSDDRSHAIRLQVADGEMKVFSSLSDTGESEDSVLVDYTGPGVEIGFNAHYLTEFLRATTEAEAAFHFKDSNSAGEFRPAGEGVDYNYRYVVMPMRI